MIVIPNQYAQLGDIIFCQTLVKTLHQGHKIIWPVIPDFVADLNDAYPDVFFIDYKLLNINYNDQKKYILDNEVKVLPLRFNDVPLSTNMGRKYTDRGLDWKIWKTHAMWCRNQMKEDAVFGWLGIEPTDKYNLIFENFSFSDRRNIKIENGYKNVYVKKLPQLSLFDYAGVIENASTIHAVSSSCVYLFEQLKLKAEEIKIYKRLPRETSHENYRYLMLSHPYEFE